MNTPDPSTMKEVLRGHDIGDAMDRLVERKQSTRDGSVSNKPLPVNNGD